MKKRKRRSMRYFIECQEWYFRTGLYITVEHRATLSARLVDDRSDVRNVPYFFTSYPNRETYPEREPYYNQFTTKEITLRVYYPNSLHRTSAIEIVDVIRNIKFMSQIKHEGWMTILFSFPFFYFLDFVFVYYLYLWNIFIVFIEYIYYFDKHW